MVDLQNSEKVENKEKSINFVDGTKANFLNVFKTAKVTVPIKKD